MTSNGVNIPKYLTEDFFQDALNDGFKRKDVKVKSLNLKLISEGGENYCSDIYRAKVQYTLKDGREIKNIALIVKDMKDSYNETIPLPSKEIDMYTQVVPEMEEILGEESILAPKCFRATKDPKEFYILEDLGDLGYTMQDRLKGLNEVQVRLLLEKIAVFHAASMVVAKKHPALIETVGKSFFENGISSIPTLANLIYGNLEHITELVKKWDGFEEIAIKLEKLRNTYDEKITATLTSDQIRFKVLNHGDLWVNNMMFKHDKDTCVDVRLIDLQICFYGSPAYDLHYFFTTSIPLDLAVTKKYDLLRTYYKSLKDTLIRLKYSPVPTWDDLLNELRVSEMYTLQTAIMAIPLIFLEKEVSKGNDLDSLKDPDLMKKQRIHIYKSKKTLASTRYILDRVNDIGVLD